MKSKKSRSPLYNYGRTRKGHKNVRHIVHTHNQNQKSKRKEKKYFTHDNRRRPFMVILNGKNVDIFTYRNKFDRAFTSINYDIHVKDYRVQDIFIGKSIKGDDAFEVGSSFGTGNSILLKITKSRYVFIGMEVFEFEPSDNIIEYYSMVGNNDVPYPVAVGEKNIYFMMDGCYLSRTHFADFPKIYSWGLDAYPRLYGHTDTPSTKIPLQKLCKRIPKKKMIHKRR